MVETITAYYMGVAHAHTSNLTPYRRILIDTGEANKSEYVNLLRETLERLKAKICKIIITHWHHDHIGGLDGVCSLYPSELF